MRYNKPGSYPEQLKEYDFDELWDSFAKFMKESGNPDGWVIEIAMDQFKHMIYKFNGKCTIEAVLEYMDNMVEIDKGSEEAWDLLKKVFKDAGLIETKEIPIPSVPSISRRYYRIVSDDCI